jgi:hypothetical protein
MQGGVENLFFGCAAECMFQREFLENPSQIRVGRARNEWNGGGKEGGGNPLHMSSLNSQCMRQGVIHL